MMTSSTPTPFAHRTANPRAITQRVAAVLAALALVIGGVSFGIPSAQAAAVETVTVASLRTNGLSNPLGIAANAPVFSWKSASDGRGVMQTSYEIRVATSTSTLPSGAVWSSGTIVSGEQLNIGYGGAALASQTRYYWQVRVGSNHGIESDWSTPAWFETGLTAAGDWNAKWIGATDPAARLAQWSNYTVSVNFTMDNLALGIYARAADLNNGYMLQLNADDGKTVRFRPHKKVNGGFAVIKVVDITNVISVKQLMTGTHVMAVQFSGNTITTSVDGNQIDVMKDNTFSSGYVGFREGSSTQGPEGATIHSVNVTSSANTVLLDTHFANGDNPFSTGGTVTTSGLKVVAPAEVLYQADKSKPILRKEFSVSKTVMSARVYAAAQGVYELSLNGKKVGDEQLAPGWTDYSKRIDYQTYDVTDLIKTGANAFGAEIGDGWFSGKIASFGAHHYGNAPSVIAQLRIDYSDGSHTWVNTDSSWKTSSGPYVQTDIIDGETYDARLAQTGWKDAGFADASWSPVSLGSSTPTALLEPQSDPPVRVTQERTPITVKESAPNTWIYDMGQNMVGVARMQLTGAADSTATIRYGEMLKPDGTLYTANLRSAKVTDYYTFAKSGTDTYTPKFTFHGYRYLEITGVTTPPTVAQVTGLVWGSDLTTTGTLATSSSMLNQLQSNITWGQRGNFLSIPTDTPARDERLGWTGDINVFSPTASYNQDTQQFLSKWLVDLGDSQASNGNLPGVAPAPPGSGCCGGGTGWSDAGITVPYTLFNTYGDTTVVKDNYPMMKKFMNYVETSTGASLIRDTGGYSDWLNLNDATSGALLGTAYYSYISGLMSTMAASIGNTADAAHYADLQSRVTAAFVAKFIAADGTVSGNSMTGYAMAIGMKLIPDAQLAAVGDKYVAKIAAKNYHLSTGFLGTPWLLPALTATGHQDIAYQMLNTKTYPSWGYEVASGATTMWERWDSLRPDGSFGDVGMNSFNHYAYGAVGDWMYQNIGGITSTSAGYKTFQIAPSIGGGLTTGTGTFDSVYGHIVSNWKKTDTGMTLDVSVPVNSTATVKIPASNRWAVNENGKPIDNAAGISVVSETGGIVTLTIGSGDYTFSSQPANIGVTTDFSAAPTSLPGDTVSSSLHVTNPGTVALSGFSAVLSLPAGLTAKPVVLSAESLAPGASIDLPFTVTIPVNRAPGVIDTTAAIEVHVGDTLRQYSVTSPLTTVSPGIVIDTLSVAETTAESPEVATLGVVVHNVTNVSISGTVVVDAPAGWSASLASGTITLAPGASASAEVAVFVPLSLTAGSQSLTARFVADGTTLATASTTFDVALSRTPSVVLDHVGAGESVSEKAHNEKDSGQGGTSVEAGLTRRYAGLTTAGSWFSYDLKVNPGQPFLLRAVETFDHPQVKSYDILVNGIVVTQRLSIFNTAAGGLSTYQLLIPASYTMNTSGTVTIKMRYNGLATYDPSIADMWTLPVPADTAKPVVTSTIAPAASNGWFDAGTTLTAAGADNRGIMSSLQYDIGTGIFTDYTAAVSLPDGSYNVTVKATDPSGNTTTEVTPVKVDGTAPVTTVTTAYADPGSTGPATVTLSAADSGSGVAGTIYAVDGGKWTPYTNAVTLTSLGAHTIAYRSTDVAGRIENGSSTITVTAAALASIALIAEAASVTSGLSLSFTTTGFDQAGNSFGDNTASTVFTSSEPSDVITGAQVSFTTAGVHTITATNEGITDTATITVTQTPIQQATNLGSAFKYAVLAGAEVTSPNSTMWGDVGAGGEETITDTTSGGTVHDSGTSGDALTDTFNAYTALNALTPTGSLSSADLAGQVITAGVYRVAAYSMTAPVTFDAQGDPNAIFVMQSDGGLNTTAGVTVTLVNGANPAHIFWVTDGAATLGANSVFDGTIISNAAVTVGAGSSLNGRAFSVTAAVTLDSSDIGLTLTTLDWASGSQPTRGQPHP